MECPRILNKKYLLNGIWQKARENANVFVGFSARAGFRKVKSMKTLPVDRRVKDFLTGAEIGVLAAPRRRI
jgi:hypothetical protein